MQYLPQVITADTDTQLDKKLGLLMLQSPAEQLSGSRVIKEELLLVKVAVNQVAMGVTLTTKVLEM